MSSPQPKRAFSTSHIAVLALQIALSVPLSVFAQYPGVIAKSDTATPVLRSVAVLEWTGEAGKPSATRLIPIAVYDGQQLNDGEIYLNRPEPLALAGGVEYELQTAGKPIGIYDVYGVADIKGAWLGFGAWKPLSAAETEKANNSFNTSQLYGSDADNDDQPVLKRKHPKGTDTDDAPATPNGSASGSGIGSKSSGSSTQSVPEDPDRPTLKSKSDSAPAPQVDPDRPTIHRRHSSDDTGMMETSTAAPDPDRPRLKRGKPDSLATTESPRLTGYPPSMQQSVAVSDAANHAEHPWKYTWANPADETKMKESLEAMARTALGLDPPPAKPTRKTVTAKKALTPLAPPEPAALADEQFRVFELSYGATATLVLTAATRPPLEATVDADQPPPPTIKRGKPTSPPPNLKPAKTLPKPAPQKFITLIAQPDLYGGILVLYKSVTDQTHLDETPRMKLIDAVDSMGDNRGELLFELLGTQQRQFAMYRVLRGSAEQLFATVVMP